MPPFINSFDYLNSLLDQIYSLSIQLSSLKIKLHQLESSFKINSVFPSDDHFYSPKLSNDRSRDAYILQQQMNSEEWHRLTIGIDELKAKIYKLKCQVAFILKNSGSSQPSIDIDNE